MDFWGNKLLSYSASTNQPGADLISSNLIQYLKDNNLSHIVIAMESTSFYSFHIANHLSCDDGLMWFKPKVCCLNPKIVRAYKKTFVDIDKTDPLDALAIADFARVGKIMSPPWSGAKLVHCSPKAYSS